MSTETTATFTLTVTLGRVMSDDELTAAPVDPGAVAARLTAVLDAL